MHLLEPGARKFVGLGTGSPPEEEEEEEEGADVAITPETLCQSPHLPPTTKKEMITLFFSLNPPLQKKKIPLCSRGSREKA